MKNVFILSLMALVCLCSCADQSEHPPGTKDPLPSATVQMPVDTQVIFSLSMLSNLPASTYQYKGAPYPVWSDQRNIDTAIQVIINYAAPKIDAALLNAKDTTGGQNFTLSGWKRVWGPAVAVSSTDVRVLLNISTLYQPNVSASSMTIFSNGSNYVVAIQATNPNCLYAWDSLDFNVSSVKPWFYDAPGSGYISRGTWLGINSLLSLQNGIHHNGSTAVQFLDSVIQNVSQANIVVTGHSLGGALSPVFALYMKHQVDSMAKLNSKIDTNMIYCLSTAGATPGDTAFANYYNSKLMNNTMKIWNYLDVVPRAWVDSLMSYVESNSSGVGGIYSAKGGSLFFDSSVQPDCVSKKVGQPVVFSPVNTPTGVNTEIAKFMSKAQQSGVQYAHICKGGRSFMGTSVANSGTLYLDIVPSTALNWLFNLGNDSTFMSQLAAQHVQVYSLYFKTKGIQMYMKQLIDADTYSVANRYCTWGKIYDSVSAPAAASLRKNSLVFMMQQNAWGW